MPSPCPRITVTLGAGETTIVIRRHHVKVSIAVDVRQHNLLRLVRAGSELAWVAERAVAIAEPDREIPAGVAGCDHVELTVVVDVSECHPDRHVLEVIVARPEYLRRRRVVEDEVADKRLAGV